MSNHRVLCLLLAGVSASAIASCASAPPVASAIGAATVAESVIVTPRTARLIVPLGRASAGEWQWYRPGTPDNELEYEWSVVVSSTRGTYQLGWRLFKFPGAAPTNGDFYALLRTGQVDIALEGVEQGQRVAKPTGLALGMRVEPSRLVFQIPDSTTVAAIFGQDPSQATLSRRLGADRLPDRTVAIVYVPDA